MKKRQIKKRTVCLAAAAFALLGTAGLGQAMGYFTTYVTAQGGYPVNLGYETEIEEGVSDMTKHIVISNTGETDCYVRVKVFSGSQFEVNFTNTEDWSLEADGYWYYNRILPAGESTPGEYDSEGHVTSSSLQAFIQVPEDYKDTFNIVVVQECTPVLYDQAGQPYADWERAADTTTDIGTADGEELTQ